MTIKANMLTARVKEQYQETWPQLLKCEMAAESSIAMRKRISNQRDLGPLAMPHSSCVHSVTDSMDARTWVRLWEVNGHKADTYKARESSCFLRPSPPCTHSLLSWNHLIKDMMRLTMPSEGENVLSSSQNWIAGNFWLESHLFHLIFLGIK